MRLARQLSATLFALAALTTTASADPIVANQWYTFGFGLAGTLAVSGSGFVLGINPSSIAAPNPAFTFTSATPFTFTIVDGFASGDRFALLNGATLIGTTSAPTAGGSCGSDITACRASAAHSQAMFMLAAGSYAFDIRVEANAPGFEDGAAFFEITQAVTTTPEPATYVMLASGLLAIGGIARRRRSA